jgi:hypothetical protein
MADGNMALQARNTTSSRHCKHCHSRHCKHCHSQHCKCYHLQCYKLTMLQACGDAASSWRRRSCVATSSRWHCNSCHYSIAMAGGATLLSSDGGQCRRNFCVCVFFFTRQLQESSTASSTCQKENEKERERELWNLFGLAFSSSLAVSSPPLVLLWS